MKVFQLTAQPKEMGMLKIKTQSSFILQTSRKNNIGVWGGVTHSGKSLSWVKEIEISSLTLLQTHGGLASKSSSLEKGPLFSLTVAETAPLMDKRGESAPCRLWTIFLLKDKWSDHKMYIPIYAHIYTQKFTLQTAVPFQLPVTPFGLVATASALPEEGALWMLPHLLQKKMLVGSSCF